MKKYLLTAAILLIAGSGCIAQNKSYKEASVGITGGVTINSMRFSPTVVQSSMIGPTMGITWRYIEEKYFGIQAELHYSLRGWEDRYKDNPELNYKRDLNYLELPIMSHIFFGNNKVRGFVNAGPQFSYLMSDSQTTNITENTPAHQDLPVRYKFDYGIIGGAGMEFRIKNKHSLLLEGRYYFGLGDLFANEKADPYEASSARTIYIQISYLFRIK